MSSKITARASGIAVSGLFVLTMGLGIVGGGGGVVHAQDNDSQGDAVTCTYAGVAYSVGSIIVMPNGESKTCTPDGSWGRIVTPSGGTKFTKIPTTGLKSVQ